jgi:hypothetical protein
MKKDKERKRAKTFMNTFYYLMVQSIRTERIANGRQPKGRRPRKAQKTEGADRRRGPGRRGRRETREGRYLNCVANRERGGTTKGK